MLRELVVYCPKDKPARFGNVINGGYILFRKALSGVERIYSYGIDSYNLNFDLAITQEFKVPGHCYACTLESFPKDNNFLVFHKEETGASLGTFSKHIMDNGDEGKNIVLKVDLEGGEWDFLEALTEQDTRLISQIVIEFHGLLKEHLWHRYTDVIKKINRYYYLCYVQALNTAPDGIVFGNKLYLHNRYGATYIRKDLGRCSINTKTQFPTSVDYPNLSGKPYIPLTGWPYRSDRENMFSLAAIIKIMRTRFFFNSVRDDLPPRKWTLRKVGDRVKASSEDVTDDGRKRQGETA